MADCTDWFFVIKKIKTYRGLVGFWIGLVLSWFREFWCLWVACFSWWSKAFYQGTSLIYPDFSAGLPCRLFFGLSVYPDESTGSYQHVTQTAAMSRHCPLIHSQWLYDFTPFTSHHDALQGISAFFWNSLNQLGYGIFFYHNSVYRLEWHNSDT